MASIQLDKPRRLKFGFNAMEHLKLHFGFKNPMQAFVEMEEGDVSILKAILESCLVGDNDGLNSVLIGDLMDNYLDQFGLDKFQEVLKVAIEESAWFRAAKKQAAKAEKEAKANKKKAEKLTLAK